MAIMNEKQLRRIIREEIEVVKSPGKNFYYHDEGQDDNGNDGPDPKDPGWIIVRARNFEDAVTKLPRSAQEKIRRAIQENLEDGGDAETIDDFLGETSGWGIPFTLIDQSDWDEISHDWDKDKKDNNVDHSVHAAYKKLKTKLNPKELKAVGIQLKDLLQGPDARKSPPGWRRLTEKENEVYEDIIDWYDERGQPYGIDDLWDGRINQLANLLAK